MTSQSDSERIADAIAALFDVYTREGVGVWLTGAKRSLGGLSPLGLLKLGRIDEFEDAVERLRVGAMG